VEHKKLGSPAPRLRPANLSFLSLGVDHFRALYSNRDRLPRRSDKLGNRDRENRIRACPPTFGTLTILPQFNFDFALSGA
jgi:hypothetical protein